MTEPRLTIVPSLVEGELRIHDIELARRLGFTQTRDIRKLIERHMGALEAMGVCATVAQTPGPRGGRPATEYYLNRKQAIFITAKSDTTDATEITIEIIEKFDAYERGVAPNGLAEIIAAIKALTETRAEIAAIREDFRAIRSGYDPTQKTVTDTYTMHEIMESQDALKPWRGLGTHCRSRLDRYSREHNLADAVRPGKSPDRYLYQRDLVRKWLTDEGKNIIKAHNDKIRGQGVLQLVPQPTRKPRLHPIPRAVELPPSQEGTPA